MSKCSYHGVTSHSSLILKAEQAKYKTDKWDIQYKNSDDSNNWVFPTNKNVKTHLLSEHHDCPERNERKQK